MKNTSDNVVHPANQWRKNGNTNWIMAKSGGLKTSDGFNELYRQVFNATLALYLIP